MVSQVASGLLIILPLLIFAGSYFRENERGFRVNTKHFICVVQLLFVNQLTYFSCNFSGISGKVKIDDQSQTKWQIYPLEFKQDFISR